MLFSTNKQIVHEKESLVLSLIIIHHHETEESLDRWEFSRDIVRPFGSEECFFFFYNQHAGLVWPLNSEVQMSSYIMSIHVHTITENIFKWSGPEMCLIKLMALSFSSSFPLRQIINMKSAPNNYNVTNWMKIQSNQVKELQSVLRIRVKVHMTDFSTRQAQEEFPVGRHIYSKVCLLPQTIHTCDAFSPHWLFSHEKFASQGPLHNNIFDKFFLCPILRTSKHETYF